MNDDVAVIGEPLLRSATAVVRVDVGALFSTHRLRLVRLAAAITLDRSLAEEVVQDVFVGVQRRRQPVDDPVAYLQRAVVNRSVSALRRRRVALGRLIPPPAVTENPEIDETWAAVSRLPARERAVVVLRFWLDLTEPGIADALQWPVGTVKSTLHRALGRLRKELML